MKVRIFITKCLAILLLLGLLLGIYFLFVRPGALRWGATQQEIAASMPGDELVTNPFFVATRAITINATPDQIWPWLVQMGYGRAGYYGYDLLENIGSPRGIRSADQIVPELQTLAVGDPMPIYPGSTLIIQTLVPNQYLIWNAGSVPSVVAFTWALIPVDSSHTRLISRVRLADLGLNVGEPLILFTEFLDHLAVRRILLGVKDRVEGRAEPFTIQAIETVTYFIGAILWITTMIGVCLRQAWRRAWIVSLAAGLVLIFVLYAHPPYWTSLILEAILVVIWIQLVPKN